MKYKFIFDLDGTITQTETLPLIASRFGVDGQLDALTKAAIEGRVPFQESFITRVSLLGRFPVDEISTLLDGVPLYKQLSGFIREHAAQCHVATGNVRAWVDKLLQRVGCEYSCSEAEIRNNQIFKLRKILKKEKVVERFQAQGYKVVFTGDGHNDMEAMRLADISIAAGLTHYPASTVLETADYAIFDEGALCRLLGQLC